MSDTRALLDRISAFRQRLESTPSLIPVGVRVAEAPPAQFTTFRSGCPNSARRHACAPFTRMSRSPSSE